ncbi:DUF523 domain-containing protein [Aminivibrio sp.]|uniref:DUF523 domain-containing protein n=1 Tax=Aminivibrio sp. TaxID=1872489 RepID=UPI002B1FA3A0|nr:DUF523 domain-containing protein [Aminivibrio sp.]MEA4952063.1 DUF523 domain-containing protein [Aminivibrio sp.]
MKILVSACLLGVNCRYDGGGALNNSVLALMERHELIPVCPELLGGLPTPREPAEISVGRVRTISGIDVTEQYGRGAAESLRLALLFGCSAALLKERSPSCGAGMVYDGTFSGKLVPGDGFTARLLRSRGIRVIPESGIGEL